MRSNWSRSVIVRHSVYQYKAVGLEQTHSVANLVLKLAQRRAPLVQRLEETRSRCFVNRSACIQMEIGVSD